MPREEGRGKMQRSDQSASGAALVARSCTGDERVPNRVSAPTVIRRGAPPARSWSTIRGTTLSKSRIWCSSRTRSGKCTWYVTSPADSELVVAAGELIVHDGVGQL